MPELPEVQAQAERMTAALEGASLSAFRLINFAGLKTFSPAPDQAIGVAVAGVGRRGKYLLLEFANGHTHVVHLMQGGRWRLDLKQSKKPRGGIARWVFATPDADSQPHEQAWLLTEAGTERRAGIWATDGDPNHLKPLSTLGPEANQVSRAELGDLLSAQSSRIHGVLRNQRVLAGIGRMLANEICFEAGLSPFANASKLDDAQLDALHDAIITVTEAALAHERTLDDIGKSADRPSKVHNRAGEPCVDADCDAAIATVEYRAYTVYYCPNRQTGGKLLADNTTSKFLR